jgi:hypothetical protein
VRVVVPQDDVPTFLELQVRYSESTMTRFLILKESETAALHYTYCHRVTPTASVPAGSPRGLFAPPCMYHQATTVSTHATPVS